MFQPQEQHVQANYWQRLDKTAAQQVLATVMPQIDPGLFPPIATEVKCQPLSFCKSFMLYRLTNYSALPAFTMDFLSDGTVFYYLSGAAEPIYRANERGPISLREDNVLNYLDFFFCNVKSDEGDIYVVRDPATLPFMSSLPLAQREELEAQHRPARIYYDPLKDHFEVNTTLYYAGGLMTAQLLVSSNGEIEVLDLSLLLSNMTPYFETRGAEDYYALA